MIQSTDLDQLTTSRQEGIAELNKGVKTNTVKETKEVANVEDSISEAKNSFSPKSIKRAIETMNKELETSGKKLAYSMHERTNQIMIKVIDIETDEVIKEIPDEKLMDMMADFREASGILVDEKI